MDNKKELQPPVEGIYVPDFPDYEADFANVKNPIIANDVDSSTKEGQEILNSYLYTKYQGEILTSVPSCNCGHLNQGWLMGVTCEYCHTPCVDILDRSIESRLWIRVPKGVNKFISPGVWTILNQLMTSSNWSLLEWLVDQRYPMPPETKPEHWRIITSLEFYGNADNIANKSKANRNLNFFYDNFEGIMQRYITALVLRKRPRTVQGLDSDTIKRIYHDLSVGATTGSFVLINTPIGRIKDRIKERELALLIRKYGKQKNRIFTTHLPMPSSLGLVIESNSSGSWVDVSMTKAMEAMLSVTQAEWSLNKRRHAMNLRAVRCTQYLSEFLFNFVDGTAGAKEGIIRRHVYGGRMPFTARCVITSNNNRHKHNGIIMPWAASVAFFDIDIRNRLLRKGWSPRKINNFTADHTNNYSPIIHEILIELLEIANGFIPITYQRSPSLKKPSMCYAGIVGFNIDPRIRVIQMSVNLTNGNNADFDGDAMHVMRVLDMKLAKRFQNLEPHRSVLSVKHPYELSNMFTPQSPQALTMHNYVYGERDKRIADEARRAEAEQLKSKD